MCYSVALLNRARERSKEYWIKELLNDESTHPIESPEENAPDKNGGVDAEAVQEPCTLQGDVAGSHTQSLARVLLQGEDIVTEIEKG